MIWIRCCVNAWLPMYLWHTGVLGYQSIVKFSESAVDYFCLNEGGQFPSWRAGLSRVVSRFSHCHSVIGKCCSIDVYHFNSKEHIRILTLSTNRSCFAAFPQSVIVDISWEPRCNFSALYKQNVTIDVLISGWQFYGKGSQSTRCFTFSYPLWLTVCVGLHMPWHRPHRGAGCILHPPPPGYVP